LPVGVDSAPRQLLWLVGGCYCYCAHTGRERERDHANTVGSGAASAWVPDHRRRGAVSPSHSPTRLCNACPSLAGLLLVAARFASAFSNLRVVFFWEKNIVNVAGDAEDPLLFIIGICLFVWSVTVC
jgi:hypothetical protein